MREVEMDYGLTLIRYHVGKLCVQVMNTDIEIHL